MKIKEICVLGGSGFLGSAIVAKLDAKGYVVKVLTRKRERAKHLLLLPNVQVVECNIMDHTALKAVLQGADVVINLIGILHQNRHLTFNAMHINLPGQFAKICADSGIKRVLHVSSLQADKNAPSEYLRSKAAGESALLAFKDKLNITIFRPSIIFGRGDSFINLFASLIKVLPFVLLVKPSAKFQPIWVEDVASCIAASIENDQTYGKTYELGGPEVLSFKEIVRMIMHTLGIQRPIFGLSDRLSYMQGFIMENLPIQLMSRDNVRSMEVDSICSQTFPTIFGVVPTSLAAIIPDYLVNKTPRGAYDRFRRTASR